MKVLYVSFYPDSYFKQILKESRSLTSQPAQKFNKLLGNGFKHNGLNVNVLVTYNHLAYDNSDIFNKQNEILEECITYHFMPVLKLRFIGGLYSALQVYLFTYKWLKQNKDGFVIVDFLKPFANFVCKAARKLKRKSIIIVTDLPVFLQNESKTILDKFRTWRANRQYENMIQIASEYVFLTEQMNLLLNKENKPYVVIEGFVDINMKNVEKAQENISDKKICLYSGAISKQFGLEMLVEGFIRANINNSELHLYGNGDYVDELEQICNKHSFIKYFGIIANEDVVRKQIEATLLINPRPTNEEYTKYSFPSKNMEYMASETPVLTTKLPGMPDEYLNICYIIDDESINGIKNSLINVLGKTNEELKLMGNKAKKFVLKEKNNIIQAKKILNMRSKKGGSNENIVVK